jgi:hypothetical protein
VLGKNFSGIYLELCSTKLYGWIIDVHSGGEIKDEVKRR